MLCMQLRTHIKNGEHVDAKVWRNTFANCPRRRTHRCVRTLRTSPIYWWLSDFEVKIVNERSECEGKQCEQTMSSSLFRFRRDQLACSARVDYSRINWKTNRNETNRNRNAGSNFSKGREWRRQRQLFITSITVQLFGEMRAESHFICGRCGFRCSFGCSRAN